MEKALFLFAIIGPIYVVTGLSVLMYSGQWMKVMNMYKKDHFAFMPLGVFAMVIGLLMLSYYNVWSKDVYVIATIFGWIALLKGAFYLLAPGKMFTGLVSKFESKQMVTLMGVFCLAVGVLLSYHAYMI
jgi:uncharacterized protein YjeT (DUF2065 family)